MKNSENSISALLRRRLLAGAAVAATLLVFSTGAASAAANCVKGDRKAPYTIGWANIYSVPTWMKQTEGTITAEVDELKKAGLVKNLMITDAQGNAQTQIQHIQSMIDANVDAIVVIAGSSTALDRVISDACDKGIAVVNFDSIVNTDKVTAKINTDSNEWGATAAKWIVSQLGGKGKIIVMNGPAGISVSDDRRKGAQPVLDANPGIQVITETNTEYNVAPAQEAMTSCFLPIRKSTACCRSAARCRPAPSLPSSGRAAIKCRRRAKMPASSSNSGRRRD